MSLSRKDVGEMRFKTTKRVAGYASSLFSLGMLYALRLKGMYAYPWLLGVPVAQVGLDLWLVERYPTQEGSKEFLIPGEIYSEMVRSSQLEEWVSGGGARLIISTQGKLDSGRKDLDPGSALPGRSSTQGELDLRRLILDLGRAPLKEGTFNLRKKELDSGNTQSKEGNLNSGNNQPEEEEPRPKESSNWAGKFQPEEEGTSTRRTAGGRKDLDPGRHDLRRYVLDLGSIQHEKEVLDSGNAQHEEQNLNSWNAQHEEENLNSGNTQLEEENLNSGNTQLEEGKLNLGMLVLDPRKLDLGRLIVTSGRARLEEGNLKLGNTQPGKGELTLGRTYWERVTYNKAVDLILDIPLRVGCINSQCPFQMSSSKEIFGNDCAKM
ncbi:hypothetical protein FNV43_RR09694 [Rhamnella rubrinervis]|uniref:Uncharacterized protein n=1 Tax=Rhamnella rubrinervis TaxID=2594499 RepID=A0A8K0MKL4_9ROSA|nr:hypothetical protein FNV43_RR09694 [Rhamnella rubrinervis]